MGARPRSRGCGTSAVPTPGRPQGRGLRSSGEWATRLALPAGRRPAEPRAGAPVPTQSARAPRFSRRPLAAPGVVPDAQRATHVRTRGPPLSPERWPESPERGCPSFERKLSPPAAPRPCARASGALTAARVSRRPGEAGPAPRRRAPAAPALAAPPPRVGSPSSRLPHSPASPPLLLLASTSPAPVGMVAAAGGLWRPAPCGGGVGWGGGPPHLSCHAATQQRHPASLRGGGAGGEGLPGAEDGRWKDGGRG